MNSRISYLSCLLLLCGLLFDRVAFAQQPASSANAEPQLHWTVGPKKISLPHELTLDLGAKYIYLDIPQSQKLLTAGGNFHNEDSLGIVAANVGDAEEESDEGTWSIYLDYEDSGYVKDDEKIDADDLMKSLREGQEEANKERVEKNFAALNLQGWSDTPRYDKSLHHLIWGIRVQSTKAPAPSVNYNTRVLGRHGFVSVNLVAKADKVDQFKPFASEILKSTTFNKGSTYEDVDKSKDKIAEYGLGGLVLGGVALGLAKKGGILLILAKFGKVIFVGIAAGGAAVAKFFRSLVSGKKDSGDGPST
jgi:uncharacterized membrane-anchored protein